MLLSSPEKRNGCQPAPGPGPGLGDLQGCGRAFHPGGVGSAELCPEGLVSGCDARELQ
ncbi:zinc finger protein 454, isoform CRA_c [Mus musculus]|nr:zinc finger protein 454, isoform CRA_c [Mus musculus]